MKTKMGIGFVVIAILIGVYVVFTNVNFNRLGAEQFYTQIVKEGNRVEGKTNTGEKYVSYEYTLQGYDKKGQEKTLTFTANKSLRKDAYLSLFVKKEGVSSYEEVKLEEIPGKAAELLKSKQGS